MLDKSPRLRFTEEELENQQVRRAADRAEQAADKADAAKSKLRTDEDRAKARAEKLRFGKKDNTEPMKAHGKETKRHRLNNGQKGSSTAQQSEAMKNSKNSAAASAPYSGNPARGKRKAEPATTKSVRSRIRFNQNALRCTIVFIFLCIQKRKNIERVMFELYLSKRLFRYPQKIHCPLHRQYICRRR